MQAFTPVSSTTISVSGTTASATIPAGVSTVRLYNPDASHLVFVRFTHGASSAVSTDMPLAPALVEKFGIDPSTTNTISAISGGTAITLYVTYGNGGT